MSASAAVLPILQSLPEGSSGTGISYYSQAVNCSRKLHLDEAMRAAHTEHAPNFRPDVGKIFHALCEIYFKSGVSDIAIELTDTNLGEAPDEAKRLFTAYSARFSPSDFARVVATEMLLPRSNEETLLVTAAVGVSPFTCRLDMAVEVDERSMEVLYSKRGLTLPGPGIYLWDFKTKGQKGSNDEVVYRHAIQGHAYQMVWNVLHPDQRCLGMVFDIIVGHKKLVDGSFYSVLVPAVSEEQELAARKWLRFAQAQAQGDVPNLLSCFDFGKPCPHLVSGACNRT